MEDLAKKICNVLEILKTSSKTVDDDTAYNKFHSYLCVLVPLDAKESSEFMK